MSQQVFAIFFLLLLFWPGVSTRNCWIFFLISKNFCLAFGESIDVYQIIVSNFYIETISRCVICHKQYSKRYKSYTRTSIHAFLSCLLSCFFFLLFFSNVEIKWNEMESIRIAWFDCNSKAKKSNHSLSYYFNLFSFILSNRNARNH